MKEFITKCDVCGVAKAEVNHWFIVFIDEDTKAFIVLNPSEKHSDIPGDVHDACGADHASVLFSRWLSTGKLEK